MICMTFAPFADSAPSSVRRLGTRVLRLRIAGAKVAKAAKGSVRDVQT